MRIIFFSTICLLSGILLTQCTDESTVVAKPHAFPKIEFPEKKSEVIFDKNYCNFSFKYPDYIIFEQDTAYFDEKPRNPCWFNLKYPSLNAEVYFSYYPINNANKFDELIGDAFDLAGKHNIKADFIEQLPIQKPNRVSGMVFDIQGAAACPFQFYLTDSTKHFLRGSLYFNSQTRPDSMAPVNNFVKRDIIEIINSFEWNN
jgi:gliding motility-associated lipoprotein GldD